MSLGHIFGTATISFNGFMRLKKTRKMVALAATVHCRLAVLRLHRLSRGDSLQGLLLKTSLSILLMEDFWEKPPFTCMKPCQIMG